MVAACSSLLEVNSEDTISQFPRSAGMWRFFQPFRAGGGPGHFRSTPSQRTGFSCVRKRALQKWHLR